MAINKKLISFATQIQFDNQLSAGDIDNRSIVFIEDKKRIWTHGVYFDTLWDYIQNKPSTLDGYGITDAAKKINSLYYVEGNTTGTAGAWTGLIPEITSLYAGLTIAYKIGVAGASTTNLNINNLGNNRVRRNTSNLTTHLPVGSVVILTYDGTYWVWADYDSGNSYDRTYWGNAITAGTPIYSYKLLMQGLDGKFYPLTLETGTGTTKTISTQEFKINSQILYYATTATVAANGTATNVYSEYPVTTLSYTANQASWTSQQLIYLKGTILSNGNFKLDNTSHTSFMTQTLPTTVDGFVYVLLGYMYTTTAMRLFQFHPMYEYRDGALRTYMPMHSHGNITDVGAIGSIANKPIITGAGGVLQVGSFGTLANTFAEGNHTHSYLPLSGGTLTGSSYNILELKRSSANGSSMLFSNSSVNLGKIGFIANGDLIIGTGTSTDGVADMLSITSSGIAQFYGTVTAQTFIGALTGNASSATKLQTARTIAGVSFDGTANIDIPFSGLTSIPNTFTPSPHDHENIVNWSNVQTTSHTYSQLPNGVSVAFTSNDGGYGSYGSVLNVKAYPSSGGGTLQLYIPYSNTYGGTGLKYRKFNYAGDWGSLNTIWDSGNLTNLNQLTTRNFSDLQNKPTTLSGYGISSSDTLFDSKYSASGHTHNYLPLDTGRPVVDLDTLRTSGIRGGSSTTTDRPAGSYEYSPYMVMQSSSDRFVQIWFDSYGGNNIYYRNGTNSVWGEWNRLALVTDNVASATNLSRSILAGNGLSGGGVLNADRTITLGTPSSITATSTNSVTATSHTHNLVMGTGSGLDADLLDGIHSKNLLTSTIYNPTLGCLVQTDIPQAHSAMCIVYITGFGYPGVINTQASFYSYNNSSIINYSAINYGVDFGDIKAFVYNGVVCLWFTQARSFQSFQVVVNYTNTTNIGNRVNSITNSELPATAERLVTITPVGAALLSSNVASATKLQTARTIAGVSFNGTANIAIPFENLSNIPNTLSAYGISASDTMLTAKNASLITSTTTTGITNTATSNINTYLNIVQGGSVSSSTKITGAGAVTVSSDINGAITIHGSEGITYLSGTKELLQAGIDTTNRVWSGKTLKDWYLEEIDILLDSDRFTGSTFSSNVIDLTNVNGAFNVNSVNNYTTYTLSNKKVRGAWARVLVNSSIPITVTGVKLINLGNFFEINTDMYLNIMYDGINTLGYYTKVIGVVMPSYYVNTSSNLVAFTNTPISNFMNSDSNIIIDNVSVSKSVIKEIYFFGEYSSITSIGSEFLRICSSLTSVDLSGLVNLTRIDYLFLDSSYNIRTLKMGATAPPILNGELSNYLTSILVPTAAVDAYKSATYWADKASIISGY